MDYIFNIYKKVKLLFFVIFLYLFFNVIFNHQGFGVKEYFINPIIVVFFAYILLKCLEYLYRYVHSKQSFIEKHNKKILLIFFIYMTIFQFVFNFFLTNANPNYSGDFGMIRMAGSELYYKGIISGSISHYFYTYPFQRMLPIMLALFYKITHFFGFSSNTSGVLLAVINTNLAILFLLLLLKKSLGYSAMILGIIVSILFTPFYLCSVFYYSDTMSILYPIALAYLVYSFVYGKYIKSVKYGLLTGLVLFLGCSIKYTVMIIFISSVIFLVFAILKYKNNVKNIFSYIMISILTFVVLSFAFNNIVSILTSNDILFAKNEQQIESLPKMYWIAMGANSSRLGAWNMDDAKNIALAKISKKEKEELATQTFFSRMEQYRLQGWIKFVTTKLAWMFGDGSFFFPITIASSIKESKKGNFISDIFLYKANNYIYYIYFAQILWILILYYITKAFFLNINSKDITFDDIILTAIVGLLIFFSFWESRSRYIFNYTPVFIYIAISTFVKYYNIKYTQNKETLFP